MHPNNTTFKLEDLFDEDLNILHRFMLTLIINLDLGALDDAFIVRTEMLRRISMRVGEY